MKRFLQISIFLFSIIICHAQQETINLLRTELTNSKNDTSRFAILDSLSMFYLNSSTRLDSAYFFIHQSISYAMPVADKKFLIRAYGRLGWYYVCISKWKPAFDITLKALSLSKQYHVTESLSFLDFIVAFTDGVLFKNSGDGLKYALDAKSHLEESRDLYFDMPFMTYLVTGNAYQNNNLPDSAYHYWHLADSLSKISKERVAIELSQWNMGGYYVYKKEYSIADSLFNESFNQSKKNNDFELMNVPLQSLAYSLLTQDRFKDAITVARSTFSISAAVKDYVAIADMSGLISDCFEKLGQKDSAYFYLKQSDSINSVYKSSDIITQINEDKFEEQNRIKEEKAKQVLENEKNKSRIKQYVFITGLLFFLIIVLIQWRNNILKKRTNILLQQQKQKVESTLSKLKSTQAQLIQSEKMASLGELTAGIAHEIQNPLNFVNNFSEVNNELIEELKAERSTLKAEEQDELLNDIFQNNEKIAIHGKRADAIVKGMLQHSHQSSGKKESTNINALCDEYLRLSYHGLRAKDKSFNADFKTDFDESIGKINIVPQDIGRVLLNLFNNAFYAVNEKKKSRELSAMSYEPLVSVQTKKINDKIEIKVSDNGNGIPQNIIDKIFQPFFTTKPTGQGTGLGLSLAYDIITKEHNGNIKVESKEGEGSRFIINLPV